MTWGLFYGALIQGMTPIWFYTLQQHILVHTTRAAKHCDVGRSTLGLGAEETFENFAVFFSADLSFMAQNSVQF